MIIIFLPEFQNNIFNKIFDLINAIKNKLTLLQQDQTLINYIFYPKIGIIPSKYVIFNHFDSSDVKKYLANSNQTFTADFSL